MGAYQNEFLRALSIDKPSRSIPITEFAMYSPGLKLFSCCDLKELIATRTNQRISEETESD